MTQRQRRPSLLTPSFVFITAAAVAYFTAYGITIPTLPKYVSDPLGGGGVAVGLGVGAFGFTALLFRPFAGIVADRSGRKRLVLGGPALVAISTVLLVPTDSLTALIALRLAAGVGEAMFFVGAVAIVNDLAPPERRGEAVSLFTISLYTGIALGPLLGEFALAQISFDAVWILSASMAGVAVGLALRVVDSYVPEASTAPRRLLHPAGLMPGTIMLTSVWGFTGYMAFVRLYTEDLGMAGAGGVLLMYGIIMVSIRLFGARLPDVLGVERAGLIGLSGSTVGLAVIGLTGSIPGLFIGTIVFAVGQALSFPAFMAWAAGAVPPAERGAAIGTTTAFIDLGFTVGPISLGAVAAAFDNQATFLAGSAIAAVGVLIQVVAGARRRRRPAPLPAAG